MHQKDCDMKDLAGPMALVALVLSSTSAFAGGPVIVEETEVEAATPRSGWIVPVIVGAIILCAIACGNDADPTTTTTLD